MGTLQNQNDKSTIRTAKPKGFLFCITSAVFRFSGSTLDFFSDSASYSRLKQPMVDKEVQVAEGELEGTRQLGIAWRWKKRRGKNMTKLNKYWTNKNFGAGLWIKNSKNDWDDPYDSSYHWSSVWGCSSENTHEYDEIYADAPISGPDDLRWGHGKLPKHLWDCLHLCRWGSELGRVAWYVLFNFFGGHLLLLPFGFNCQSFLSANFLMGVGDGGGTSYTNIHMIQYWNIFKYANIISLLCYINMHKEVYDHSKGISCRSLWVEVQEPPMAAAKVVGVGVASWMHVHVILRACNTTCIKKYTNIQSSHEIYEQCLYLWYLVYLWYIYCIYTFEYIWNTCVLSEMSYMARDMHEWAGCKWMYCKPLLVHVGWPPVQHTRSNMEAEKYPWRILVAKFIFNFRVLRYGVRKGVRTFSRNM